MSRKKIESHFRSLKWLAYKFRKEFDAPRQPKSYILLFAHNGVGKTRLSMEFKDIGKRRHGTDTLYFNAFTEDLFSWDNDIENDSIRVLKINSASRFFDVFRAGTSFEGKVFSFLQNYADFEFEIDYSTWNVPFSRKVVDNGTETTVENIKISRGEENIFIWCVYLAICQLVVDKDASYSWVKYLYIDDPISSLDENNTIAVANDLVNIITTIEVDANGDLHRKSRIKAVISSHHTLFFNVMFNELKRINCQPYLLHKKENTLTPYVLVDTTDTPFFHHIAVLRTLQRASKTGEIYTYHFNMLRSILEKTAVFFGETEMSTCFDGMRDKKMFQRAVHLFSHGKYSIYEPVRMTDDNKKLFRMILKEFLAKYKFNLPELL